MWRSLGAVAALAGLCTPLWASDVTIHLANGSGTPLVDAAVFLDEATPGLTIPSAKKRATIVQRDRLFEPFVSVVGKGTAIAFPNYDSVLHHVYSFSPAKQFEFRLYKGTPTAPVVFDKPGVVAVGCNVHDWMLAYVVVLDSEHFAKSNKEGVAVLRGLAPGTHAIMIWYPGMRAPTLLERVTLADGESKKIDKRLNVTIRVRPIAPPFDPMRYFLFPGHKASGADVCSAARSWDAGA